MKHYVYRITNKLENKHYYGVRTSHNIEPEDDLGIYYFSSSADKKFIRDQKENLNNYRYKIIKKFTTREDAIELEIKLHNKFDVGINESFYNRCKQTSKGFDRTGMKTDLTNEHKLKISKANKGRKFSQKHKENISLSRKKGYDNGSIEKLTEDKNPMYRKGHSEEARRKISKVHKGKILTQETKNKISKAKIGIERKQEDIIKMSENRKGKGAGKDNGMTKRIEIFDEEDNLKFISEGNFKLFCEENSLPYISFIKNFNKKIYQSKIGPHYAKKNGFDEYIGWTAKV